MRGEGGYMDFLVVVAVAAGGGDGIDAPGKSCFAAAGIDACTE